MTTNVRIDPVTPDQMTAEQLATLGPWKDLVFSQVLLRHRKMYDFFVPYLKSVVADTDLPQRDRQIVCLRMLELGGDVYEKTHHVHISHKVGLSQDEVDQIIAGGGSLLTEWDRVVLTAVEELHSDQVISDTTWAQLSAHYSPEQKMELVSLAGCYLTMAMITKSFGMQLEPDLENFNKNRDYTNQEAA